MRDFAKAFYLSKEWRRARTYIFNRDAGLCVRCGALGEIVHHKEHLTPQNISNPEITLGEGNLELLCYNGDSPERAEEYSLFSAAATQATMGGNRTDDALLELATLDTANCQPALPLRRSICAG